MIDLLRRQKSARELFYSNLALGLKRNCQLSEAN